jgi:hypothetical protein
MIVWLGAFIAGFWFGWMMQLWIQKRRERIEREKKWRVWTAENYHPNCRCIFFPIEPGEKS